MEVKNHKFFDTSLQTPEQVCDFSWKKLSEEDRSEIISKLLNPPTDATVLDISGLKLADLSPEFLEDFIDSIQEQFKEINLSFNKLGTMNFNKFLELLQKISPNLNKLDLSHNKLNKFTSKQIDAAIQALRGVKVNASHNRIPVEYEQQFLQVDSSKSLLNPNG